MWCVRSKQRKRKSFTAQVVGDSLSVAKTTQNLHMFFDVANIGDLLNPFPCNLTDSKSMDAMFLPIQF